MQGIDSRRYLGNSEENTTMHTRRKEWVAPLIALLTTIGTLVAVASIYRTITTELPIEPPSSFRLV